MRTREPISDTEYAECQKCVRKWAFKKMMKLEKKNKTICKNLLWPGYVNHLQESGSL